MVREAHQRSAKKSYSSLATWSTSVLQCTNVTRWACCLRRPLIGLHLQTQSKGLSGPTFEDSSQFLPCLRSQSVKKSSKFLWTRPRRNGLKICSDFSWHFVLFTQMQYNVLSMTYFND